MLLIGVCRRWREVATSTPSLWCKLHVEVDDADWQRAASCYDSWLKWSRGLPLSLVVKCYKNSHSITLWRLLHPYMNQIRSLSILFFSSAYKPELLLTDLPALEELTILFNDHVTLSSVSQLPSTMRRFTAILPSFNKYRRNYLGSMWDRLTDVGIGAIDEPHSAIELLQLCPSLSSLAIRDSPCYLLHAIEPLTHPKVQSLRINLRGPTSELHDTALCELFGVLSLPNLCFLEVRGNHPGGTIRLHDALKVKMTAEQRAEYIALISSLKMGIVEEECFITCVETMLFLHEATSVTSIY
ncbi:hypothetical protein BDR03DRAFT_284097 [Suillus americanus]|nr:hypothetical protein BDR03DRAFT_284097 [Suillus americanus]